MKLSEEDEEFLKSLERLSEIEKNIIISYLKSRTDAARQKERKRILKFMEKWGNWTKLKEELERGD